MLSFKAVFILFLISLFFAAIVYLYKHIRLHRYEKLLARYKEMLNDARVIRSNYFEVVNKKNDVELKENINAAELLTKRQRLNSIRKELRKLLDVIRDIGQGRFASEIDRKVMVHKRIKFQKLWHEANAFKLSFNIMKRQHGKLKEELRSFSEKEERAQEQWFERKDMVMQYYDGLKTEWGNFPPPDFSGIRLKKPIKKFSSCDLI